MCECVCISVSVGYEYESCPGIIQWERRSALMQGFELVPSNLGGWSLDKHHSLNIRSGEIKQYTCVLLSFVFCLWIEFNWICFFRKQHWNGHFASFDSVIQCIPNKYDQNATTLHFTFTKEYIKSHTQLWKYQAGVQVTKLHHITHKPTQKRRYHH